MSFKPLVTRENYKDFLEYEEFKVLQGNIIKKTDSYNLSHQDLKVNTDWEVSHIYNRKRGIILYGFNKIVHDLLSTQVTEHDVHVAAAHAIRNNLPFPYELWMKVATELNGYIPIKIEALPDGTWCRKGTPFAQIGNTVEGFGELVTWFEGIFLKCAFASGCATRAFEIRKYLQEKKEQYGFPELFMWKIHSFAFRGYNSDEDSFFGGTAYNLFLHGTDDFQTSWFCQDNTQGSIRALAHKVTVQYFNMVKNNADHTYKVRKDLKGDVVAMYHAIDAAAKDKVPMNRIVALVIDTYDAWRVITHHAEDLIHYAKTAGVWIVFRPDSGDTISQVKTLYRLGKEFNILGGYSCIIGEGITFDVIQSYDRILELDGIPLMFCFYGIGGGFHKDIDRDWSGMAMKTAYSNGVDTMKLVKTDPFKSSIPGAVQVVNINGEVSVVSEQFAIENHLQSMYEILYEYTGKGIPFQLRRTWNDIFHLANQQTGEQQDIVIGPDILAKIEHFKHLFLED